MIDKPEKFWKRLNNWIEQEGLNLHSFAKLADINYSSLNNPRERNSIPGPEILVKIAEATGLSLEYFLTGKDPWTKTEDKDLRRVAAAKELLNVDDATLRMVRAVLDAAQEEAEEKKRRESPGDTEGVGLHPRKRGGGKK